MAGNSSGSCAAVLPIVTQPSMDNYLGGFSFSPVVSYLLFHTDTDQPLNDRRLFDAPSLSNIQTTEIEGKCFLFHFVQFPSLLFFYIQAAQKQNKY